MTIMSAIFAVFTAIGEWITSAISALVPIFWTAGETAGTGNLTFMGNLAVIGLGISVIFLIMGIIQRFLKFGA